MQKKLVKAAMFTDIHIGAKGNSEQHNTDCTNYIDWFCDKVINNPDIDHVVFCGDWHETRANINISTLKYSYEIAEKINALKMPVYMILGNHDLYHRSNREIHSVLPFNEFDNFIIVDEPTVFDNIGDGTLLCPYLFHEEYPTLSEYSNVPVWMGHFEFKGFVVTGYNITMKSGPDHTDFNKPKDIISGHFHKRQKTGNVTYMGNTFPTNFSDAGDFERGMMIYDHTTNEREFHDWEECPKYIKAKLSDIVDGNIKLFPDARVKCIADVPITFEESIEIRKSFIESNNLREFVIEESAEVQDSISDTIVDVDADHLGSVDELVVEMFQGIESEHIDNELLIDIYKNI